MTTHDGSGVASPLKPEKEAAARTEATNRAAGQAHAKKHFPDFKKENRQNS